MIFNSEKILHTLRNSKEFLDYLEDRNNTKDLTNLIVNIASLTPNTMQIRYIDKNGFEKSRIDVVNGEIIVSQKDKLQNKSNRYYFILSKKEAMLEKIWFTRFDLNIEHGEIERPYKPTIRGVLPIKNSENSFDGILIVNYFAGNILEKALNKGDFYKSILFDNNGYTIYHYNLEKSWGNVKTEKRHIAEDLPDYYSQMLGQEDFSDNTRVFSKKLDLNIFGGVNIVSILKEEYVHDFKKHFQLKYIIPMILILIYFMFGIYLFRVIFARHHEDTEELAHFNELVNITSKISKIGFWEYHDNTGEFIWSEGVYAIFGVENQKEKITLDTILRYVSHEDQISFNRSFIRSIHEKKEFFSSHKIFSRNGQVKHIEERAIHFYNKRGKYIYSVGTTIDVSEKTKSEIKYKTILESATDGIHIVDMIGNIIESSPSFAETLGYKHEEIKSLNIHDLNMFIPVEAQIEFMKDSDNAPVSFETKFSRRDGKIIDLHVKARSIRLDNKIFYYASMRDISQKKSFERTILHKNEELEIIFNTALECIALLDRNTNYIKFNGKCLKLLGYTPEELEQQSCFSLTKQDFLHKSKIICEIVMRDGKYENFEKICISKNGEEKIINSSIAYIKSREQFLITMADYTELRKKEQEIIKRAYLDELTQLPNRKAFNDAITESLKDYRQTKKIFSLIILDIDFFKSINDTYGHRMGDEVLSKFSRIVENNLRGNDEIFRVGGEEFMILLPGIGIKQGFSIADRIRNLVKDNLTLIKDREITVSCGVTEVTNGDTFEAMYSRADKNLYRAKENGRDCVYSDIN
ncbi:PAS domain S-box/diguanylate cyclase (GGDEF) domain-containing protein [Thiovulum sp. ES]|nr:PAS domain S-box/diguanylate cyclase (GGDEF) domain-containing protein [Thiovulum sp. ES]